MITGRWMTSELSDICLNPFDGCISWIAGRRRCHYYFFIDFIVRVSLRVLIYFFIYFSLKCAILILDFQNFYYCPYYTASTIAHKILYT